MKPPLDPGTLQALRLVKGPDGGSLLDQVVHLALASLPEHLEGLRRHLASGEREGLQRLAHILKGTSGSFGAKGLSDCAKALERAVREGDGANLDQKLQEVEAEALRVTLALRELQSS